jgi:glycyl-tRNA synthetase beta subunit
LQDDLKATILDKEKRKLYLLKQEEETWRQKSRVRWLAAGDRNTKFFHAFTNSRKKINTIWDITKEDGTVINKTTDLQKEVVSYFQNVFKAQDNIAISDQLAVLKNYPRIFSMEEGIKVVEPVTLAEILTTLKGFKASKIPGPRWLDGGILSGFF